MEYRPRYTQPFTLEEARQLAVPIITEEISRLQNSLSHLQRTQEQLKEALATSPDDPDLTEAFEENEVVIGSQNERITMLQIVLSEKGVRMSAHYSVQETPTDQRPQPADSDSSLNGRSDAAATNNGRSELDGLDPDDNTEGSEGVYL